MISYRNSNRLVVEKIDDNKTCIKFCSSGTMPCQTSKSIGLNSSTLNHTKHIESTFITLTDYMLSTYMSNMSKMQDTLGEMICQLLGHKGGDEYQPFVAPAL